MDKLTREERERIAIEELKKNKFQLLSSVTACEAGKIIADTNAEELKLEIIATINGVRKKITSLYTIADIV